MKQRLTALVLALVMTLGLTVQAGAFYMPEEITADLVRDAAVTYNGALQTMTDAAGNEVYPIFYNDTVYLPIRAVGNMLGAAVEWDEETQTVRLDRTAGEDRPAAVESASAPPSDGGRQEITARLRPGVLIRYNGVPQAMRDAAGNPLYPISYNDTTYLPLRILGSLLCIPAEWDEETRTVRFGCDWVELDWSTAGDGYFRARLTDEAADYVLCTVRWRRRGDNSLSRPYNGDYSLTPGQWTTIPLLAGSTEYRISVIPVYSEDLPAEEAALIEREPFRTSFTANVSGFDLDTVFLMSTGYIDFEHAPETCAKALEITGDCTTDAEKITAVFYYVAENIQYDHDLAEAELAAIDAYQSVPPRDLALDHILESRKGVCEHKALLMAGMLRSLGIPCKVVSGRAVLSDGTTGGHAWVAVKPGTGELDMEALGAGTDSGGWVRLDPTNAHSKAFTADDERYRPAEYC